MTSLSGITYGNFQNYGNSINNINTTNNYQNLYMVSLSSSVYGSLFQPYGSRLNILESDTQNQSASTFYTNFNYNVDISTSILSNQLSPLTIGDITNNSLYYNLGILCLQGENGTGNYRTWELSVGAYQTGMSAHDTQCLRFIDKTISTERARFDSNGNFGIGTATPSTLLSVNGTTTTNKLIISETTGTTMSAIDGSLVIKHSNLDGTSSIVFPSTNNNNSDYGNIKYMDDVNNSTTAELSRLVIGIESDPTNPIYKACIILYPGGSLGYVGINNMNPKIYLWFHYHLQFMVYYFSHMVQD
jgi:hypothetical protein